MDQSKSLRSTSDSVSVQIEPSNLNSIATAHHGLDDLANPPGTLLMWTIVLLEVLVFGFLLAMVARDRSLNREMFHLESLHLQLRDGVSMTLALLLSGFLAAEGVRLFFNHSKQKSLICFVLSTLSGLGFIVLKLMDFQHKIELGLMVEKNDFWQSYWLLMGFHFFHVLVGVGILAWISYGIFKDRIKEPQFAVRGGVLFWHMCDIIWLFLLPLFYLGGSTL